MGNASGMGGNGSTASWNPANAPALDRLVSFRLDFDADVDRGGGRQARMEATAWRQPVRRPWEVPLFLLVLSILVWYAYAPSLRHVARADQLIYLLDTYDCDSF